MTTITTYSGKTFDYANPQSESIVLGDIAHGLSQCCRFAGQIHKFYSVAQHCCWVADLTFFRLSEENHPRIKELTLIALLHDAAEAYTGDIPTPLKDLIPNFKKIENIIQKKIIGKFGPINYDYTNDYHLIKWADDQAYKAERHSLLTPTNTAEYEIDVFWSMEHSKIKWLEYYELVKDYASQ